MLSQYIQSPYINLPFGLAKPALILTVLYLLGLALFLFSSLKKDEIEFKFRLSSKGEINIIIISVVGFIVLVLSCIISHPFTDT